MSDWETVTPGSEWEVVQPQKRSVMDEVGRQIGLTGRMLAGGAAQAVEPFTEPVRYLLHKAGVPGQEHSIEDNTDALLSKAGVPEPESKTEDIVQGVGRFATSVAGGYGVGKVGDDAITRAIGGPQPQQAVPASTPEQLKEYSQALYKRAEDAGVVLNPQSFGNTVKRTATRVAEAGIDPTLHPKATAALKRLTDAMESGNPLPLKEVETLRRVINGAAKSVDADERRIAKIMQTTMDDYVLNLRQNDVVAGDAESVGTILKDARNLWSRKSKSEVLEGAVAKADIRKSQLTQSGYENALRTQFRQIAMNDKTMRMFSPEEQAAIKKIATGAPMDNALRMLGKLAPRGIFSGIIGPGAVTAVAGPEAAMATLAVGEAARRGATAATSRNVSNAIDLVRRGSPAPQQGIPQSIPPWMIGSVIGLDEPAY